MAREQIQIKAPEGTKAVMVPGLADPIYFPEEMDNDQIAHAIETDILPHRADILKESIAASRQKMFAEEGPYTRFMAGVGSGLSNVGAGVKQLALKAGEAVGAVDPGSYDQYTRERMEDNAPLEQSMQGSGLATAGRIVGEAAPLALIPGGAAGSLGRMAVTGAVQGALASQIPFVNEGESRVGRAIGGAAGGAAGSLAMGVLGKGVNALRGKFANPAQGALVRQAEKEGINLSYGDVTQSPGVQRAETLLEQIPMGTAAFRKEGGQQVTSAIDRRVAEVRDAIRSTPWSTLDAVKDAAAKGNDEAKVILGQVADAGDDWGRIIQASGNLQRFNVKRQADALYDQVRNLAGDQNVPVSRTKAAVKGAIDYLEQSKLPPQKVRFFKSILNNLTEADDFEGALLKAGQSANQAGQEATTRTSIAQAAAKAAKMADREKTAAVSEASSAAGSLAKYKKYGTDFGWWYDEALNYAKNAAQDARQAAVSAQAKGAVGGLVQGEAETAARKATQSMRELAIADGTATLARTQSPEAAARILVGKYKLAGDDLQSALSEATRRVQGAPARAGGVDNSFTVLQKFRSQMRNEAEKAARSGDFDMARLMREVKTAAEKDMGDFAQAGGYNPNSSARAGLARMWRKADDFYRTEVVPLKDRSLMNALKTATPDEIFGKFIQKGKYDRAANFYKALDPRGQAAVRYGLVSQAAEAAFNEVRGFSSPGSFVRKLQNMDPGVQSFFRGGAKQELDGFTKLMQHVERHGQFAENPPTGNRLIPMLFAGDIVKAATMGGAKTVAVGTSIAPTLRFLFTTKAGRNFLLAANRVEVGTPAMTRILDGVTRSLRAPAAIAAGTALSTAAQDTPKQEAQ